MRFKFPEYRPLFLFELASQHMNWLAERQSVTAANIANADTPGYRSRDIADFGSVMDKTGLDLSVTSRGHMALGRQALLEAATVPGSSWDQAHSGNNVTIERELMTAGQNNRMMNLDTGIARSFHRMLMSSLKV